MEQYSIWISAMTGLDTERLLQGQVATCPYENNVTKRKNCISV